MLIILFHSSPGNGQTPIAQTGHISPIRQVCYSDDNNYIATLSENNRIITWDIRKKLQGNSIDIPDSIEIRSLDFIPGESFCLQAITSTGSRKLDVNNGTFDRTHGSSVKAGPEEKYKIQGAVISFGNVANPGYKTKWPNTVYSRNPFVEFNCADYSTAKDIVIAGDDEGKLYIWRLSDGMKIKVFSPHYSPIRDISISNDGRTFVTVGDDRLIRIFNTDDYNEVFTFKPLVNIVSSVNFDPKSSKFVVSTSLGNIIEGRFTSRSLILKNVINKIYPATYATYSGKSNYIIGGFENNFISTYHRSRKEIADITLVHPLSIGLVNFKNVFINVFQSEKIRLYSKVTSISSIAGYNSALVNTTENIRKYEKRTPFIIDIEKGSKLAEHPDGEVLRKGEKFKKDSVLSYIRGNTIYVIDDRKIFQGGRAIPFVGHTDKVVDWDFDRKSGLLISCGSSGELNFWDLNTGELLNTVFIIGDEDYIIFSPDNYYYSPSKSIDAVSFSMNGELYPSAQFDIIYNRPDMVLKRFSFIDSSLIKGLESAYQKRLTRLNFTEDMFDASFHIPELKISNKAALNLTTNQESLELELELSDSKFLLNRINVWVNNVPVYGIKGIDLMNKKAKTLHEEVEIELSSGNNRVEVSCINEKGVESVKETFEVRYVPQNEIKQDLYLIAVSTSEYKQNQYNLKYAVKDGRDLVQKLVLAKGYDDYHIDTLFDEQVTVDNVKRLKEKLLKSNVEDQVVLFVSGHGLLDYNYDFYLASYDMDFADPSARGVSYELLNDLLDSIPARKKLFMMDACHSGEIDKEELIVSVEIENVVGMKSGVKSYSYKSGLEERGGGGASAGLQNSFKLMQEYFSDLNRGSGTVVISAAAGEGYAMESDLWKNGIFTYSFLEGIKTKKADSNSDGEISVSEIRKYVFTKVKFLTGGQQSPTSRQENLEYDFRVW